VIVAIVPPSEVVSWETRIVLADIDAAIEPPRSLCNEEICRGRV
jgi:hypothetical protein